MKIKKLLTLSLFSLGLMGLASCDDTTKVDDSENGGGENNSPVVTPSVDLTEMKATAKTEIDTYASGKLNEASKDDDGTVAQAVTNAKSNIDNAQTEEALRLAITQGKTSIDQAIANITLVSPDVIPTVYFVGDSTMCTYKDTDDSSHYYKRYGYGSQFYNYINSDVTITNLALSGRTTVSFKAEANYSTLTSSIKSGDYVIIGFAHNDQKVMSTEDLKTNLKNDYIDVAKNAGATPILCTPIVRANSSNDYTGTSGHITSDGDYAQAVRDLATAESVELVDLTTLTKNKYTELGYAEAINYHAMASGKYDTDGTTVIPNYDSADKTHLNIYGAKEVAYMLATELKKSKTGIEKYILANITEPTKAADLVAKEGYKVPVYSAPDLVAYKELITNGETNADGTSKTYEAYQTITEGWYGTAFGDLGGDPKSSVNGNFAKEVSEGVFEVGNATKEKGKFANGGDGFAIVFQQIESNKNFEFTANAKVLTSGASVKQTGFGIMLRDDIHLLKNDKTVGTGNYVAAGFVVDGNVLNTNLLFSRDSVSTITKTADVLPCPAYAVDDEATLKIVRNGQMITTTVIFKGTTYTTTYYDFDKNLTITDSEYFYIGMFANRMTSIQYTNVVVNITGTAVEA